MPLPPRPGAAVLTLLALATGTPPAPRDSFAAPAATRPDAGAEVDAIADAYLRARFAAFPEFVTQLGLPGARHDRVRDRSAAAERAWWRQEDALLARLQRVAAGDLSRNHRTTHAVLLEELEDGGVPLRALGEKIEGWLGRAPPS